MVWRQKLDSTNTVKSNIECHGTVQDTVTESEDAYKLTQGQN